MFKLNLKSLLALLRSPGHTEWEASGETSNGARGIGPDHTPVPAKQSFIVCEHPDVDAWLIASSNPLR